MNLKITTTAVLLRVLGQPPRTEQHTVIVFSARCILGLNRATRLSDVPWVFLYREPVVARFANETTQSGDNRAYSLLPLLVCRPMLRLHSGRKNTAAIRRRSASPITTDVAGGTLVNYSQLPEAV